MFFRGVKMNNFICVTCGHQYTETGVPLTHCLICEDERQYIGHKGQSWTTIPELQKDHHNRIEDIAPNLTGIGMVPAFALGNRALLVQTPKGNVLWDCISLLDDATVEAVRARGSQPSPSRIRIWRARWWNGAAPLGMLPSIGTWITGNG
jgi:hypothetical protein